MQGRNPGRFQTLQAQLRLSHPRRLTVEGAALGEWDSLLPAFLLQCVDYCREQRIELDIRDIPEGVSRLLAVSTAVIPHQQPQRPRTSIVQLLRPARLLRNLAGELSESLAFLGEVTLAVLRLLSGRATTRLSDFRDYCYQAGPDAFAIISLTSVLVGMILAYLGAVQLRQFGAEIYVADLVVIGTLREMGVLMTAVVMAGRTGAAYAAQLGSMQSNDEIDAIVTMGISPVEFLVLPRMLALIAIMPLLTLYADLLGMLGGAAVAGSMGISWTQYLAQAEDALSFTHLGVGLLKSLVFAALIAHIAWQWRSARRTSLPLPN